MDSLPNELLIQIALQLDVEPPSIVKFRHEPTPQLTLSDSIPLKCLSQVSWLWRKIVLPILFQYCRIALDPEPQWIPVDARLIDSMQGQLTKLSTHEFMIYTKMRSKFKSSSAFAFEQNFDDLLINLCRIQEGDDFFKSVPRILWLPHLPTSFLVLTRLIEHNSLKHHIKSVVVYTNQEYQLRLGSTADAPLTRAVNEIWTHLFSYLEPLRLVVAAPPATLAGLLDTQMQSADAWAFDMTTHYIELLQPDPLRLEHMTQHCRPWNSTLIHTRPWYHLSYNEGSSIAAYSTYEYHLKQSPKILFLVLLQLAKEAHSCCNLTSLAFTAIFPFATNTTNLIRALSRIPTLTNLSVQLAPGAENNLLSDRKRMGRAQSSDVWLEWRESYKVLASYLGVVDFAHGAEFHSWDCGTERMASEVRECMDLLRKRGAAWREVGNGRWLHDGRLDGEAGVDA